MAMTVAVLCLVSLAGPEEREETKIDTTKLEKYEKRVIIDAKWGSGPGEFGKVDNIEGPSTGPAAFTISSKGNIFVLDNVNNRVQKFDGQGNYISEFDYKRYKNDEEKKQGGGFFPFAIAVDNEECIYLLGAVLPGEIGRVCKYSPEGKLCVEYKEIPIRMLDCFNDL